MRTPREVHAASNKSVLAQRSMSHIIFSTLVTQNRTPRCSPLQVPRLTFLDSYSMTLMLSACLISTCKTRGYISHGKSPMVPSSKQGALRFAISRRSKPGSATFGHHCMTRPAVCHSRGTSQTYAVLWPVITNACFRMLQQYFVFRKSCLNSHTCQARTSQQYRQQHSMFRGKCERSSAACVTCFGVGNTMSLH